MQFFCIFPAFLRVECTPHHSALTALCEKEKWKKNPHAHNSRRLRKHVFFPQFPSSHHYCELNSIVLRIRVNAHLLILVRCQW
jgi:hypothetical protein